MGDSEQGTIGTLGPGVGTELQERSLAEEGAQCQQLKADPITLKQKKKQGGKEADIYVIGGK